MSTEANDAVRTDGKTRSSRNAIRYGLYTIHDFIREGEEREYAKTLTSLMAELSPEGILEQTCATQIMAANWRLRRCGLVEFDLAESDLDPMAAGPEDIQAEKTQKSVDRARAQAFSLFRRALAELRKLQDERTIEDETNTEPTDPAADPIDALEQMLGLSDSQIKANRDLTRKMADGSFCKPAETPAETPAPTAPAGGSFCKPAAATPAVSSKVPRNAPCPCGSRQKYKRCCGFSPAEGLNKAA
jgi:uncharacterized protein YecA (UPF0149 family)